MRKSTNSFDLTFHDESSSSFDAGLHQDEAAPGYSIHVAFWASSHSTWLLCNQCRLWSRLDEAKQSARILMGTALLSHSVRAHTCPWSRYLFNTSLLLASFSTVPVTIMGYTTQARRSPAWSVPSFSGRSKMSVNGWRNTVRTITWPTWRPSPNTPSQVNPPRIQCAIIIHSV